MELACFKRELYPLVEIHEELGALVQGYRSAEMLMSQGIHWGYGYIQPDAQGWTSFSEIFEFAGEVCLKSRIHLPLPGKYLKQII